VKERLTFSSKSDVPLLTLTNVFFYFLIYHVKRPCFPPCYVDVVDESRLAEIRERNSDQVLAEAHRLNFMRCRGLIEMTNFTTSYSEAPIIL